MTYWAMIKTPTNIIALRHIVDPGDLLSSSTRCCGIPAGFFTLKFFFILLSRSCKHAVRQKIFLALVCYGYSEFVRLMDKIIPYFPNSFDRQIGVWSVELGATVCIYRAIGTHYLDLHTFQFCCEHRIVTINEINGMLQRGTFWELNCKFFRCSYASNP